MRAGTMRHRIAVFAQPATQDSFGEPIPDASPTPVLQCWAEIRAATSKEIYAAGVGFSSEISHTIRMRFPAVVPEAGMTVQFRGRTFLVQGALDPDELERELRLGALEQTK